MDLISEISKSIADLKEEETISLVKKAIASGIDPKKILDGLSAGMKTIGDNFEKYEYFLPELVIGAEIMTKASKIVTVALPKGTGPSEKKRVVIGTAAGDIHNIGKNLVVTFLEVAGFDVNDIGEEVPTRTFVKRARQFDADIIAMSALLTTSMANAADLIKYLEDAGLRKNYKVMVGGGPVLEEDAERFGADGWAIDAPGAVIAAKKLLGME